MMYRLETHSLDTDEDGFFITDYVVINEAQYKDIMEIANQMIEFYEPAKDVIRCKDCRWAMLHTQQCETHLCKCGLNSDSMWLNADEDFCSWAERREE